MGRRRERLLLVVSLMVVVLGVGVGLASLFFLSPGTRSDVLAVGGFAVALIGGVLVPVLGALLRARRPADPRPVDTLADLLAQAVHTQWREEANKRKLLPAPLPLDWSLSDLPVAGPVEAAVGDPGVASACPPLPGQARVTEEQLRAGGGRSELFAVYAGIGSGRVVVVGAPGAGKSGTAVLLLLDALAHREHVDGQGRTRVPVPVLLTARGWDPATCSVQDWLVPQLAMAYPMFQHRGGQAEAAAVVNAEAVALILDGLDEMEVTQRPVALQALSDVPFRVVVLTRSQEMVQAASAAWLVGAVAIQLQDVTGSRAAEYLRRARSGPPPLGWTELLTELQENPDGFVASGLSTPLALTLVRDTYRAGDDVSDLINGTLQRTDVEFAQHLIAGVLPDAYTRRPGWPAPRYSLPQAEHALAFLARQMNQDHTRDLAWWQIPRWAPTTPRMYASVFAGGLLGGLLGCLQGGVTFVIGDVLGVALGGIPSTELALRLLGGLAFGLGVGLPLGLGVGRGGREPTRVKNWRVMNLRSVLTAGLAYGLLAALLFALGVMLAVALVVTLQVDPDAIKDLLTVTMVGGAAAGLVGGLTISLPLGLKRGLLGGFGEGEGSPQELVKSRRNDRVAGLVAGSAFGLVGGLLVGLVGGIAAGVVAGIMFALAVGLIIWFMFGLVPRLAGGIVAEVRFAEGEAAQGPMESWRNDRVFGLVAGIAFGLANGLVAGSLWFALSVVSGHGVVVGLVAALAAALGTLLVVGVVYGITSSATWSTTLAWLQLQRSGRVPAVGLMAFLEDARERGVLRTVGAVYQFRHATLQDQLAGADHRKSRDFLGARRPS